MIVFVVCVVMLIQTINKDEPRRDGTPDQTDHASSSDSEAKSKDYRSGDKED
jgi:protein disulfide-isomerase A1